MSAAESLSAPLPPSEVGGGVQARPAELAVSCPVCGVAAGDECVAVDSAGVPDYDRGGRHVQIAPHGPRRSKAKPAEPTIIRTNRGNLKVDERGNVEPAGIWRLVKRELRTGAEVRKMAGRTTTRATLLRWRRTQDFPAPVVTYPAKGGPLELYSRTEVEAWLERRRQAAQQPS